jgi:hypothetical protein
MNDQAFLMTYLLTIGAGISVIGTHWRAWPILIFLVAWIGIVRFRPEEDVKMTPEQWLFYTATILAMIGVLLMAISGGV